MKILHLKRHHIIPALHISTKFLENCSTATLKQLEITAYCPKGRLISPDLEVGLDKDSQTMFLINLDMFIRELKMYKVDLTRDLAPAEK